MGSRRPVIIAGSVLAGVAASVILLAWLFSPLRYLRDRDLEEVRRFVALSVQWPQERPLPPATIKWRSQLWFVRNRPCALDAKGHRRPCMVLATCKDDQTIIMSLGLIYGPVAKEFGTKARLRSVYAHEYAHILQFAALRHWAFTQVEVDTLELQAYNVQNNYLRMHGAGHRLYSYRPRAEQE